MRIKDCDAHKITMQVISTIPVLFNYWAQPKDCYDISRFLNDHISDVVRRYPNRFIGLGTIPMQDPDLACRELERCVNELGLAGIEIGSHINDWNLNEKRSSKSMNALNKTMHVSSFIHGIWSAKIKCQNTGCHG